MSAWEENQLEARIVEVLEAVPAWSPGGHHFGSAYITAYQLAVELEVRNKGLCKELGYELGGRGAGDRSFSQYIARELSRRIKADDAFPVEGAFLANQHLDQLVVTAPDGTPITASFIGANQDLSLFRLKKAASGQ